MDDKLFPQPPGEASFVAIGDSFTEGLNDAAPGGGFRGWADRLAGLIAAEYPGLRYANLAVRGKLLRQIVAEQVPAAASRRAWSRSPAAATTSCARAADPDALAELFDARRRPAARLRRPGADVHRLRPGRRPGAAAAARPDAALQHAPARHRRRARLLPGRPVVHAVPARRGRLVAGPAAPDRAVAPAGGAARVRGARRPGHRGLAAAPLAADAARWPRSTPSPGQPGWPPGARTSAGRGSTWPRGSTAACTAPPRATA